MEKNKIFYSPPRRRHGEGTGKFCTFNLQEKISEEFKLLLQAYSEVYGQKVTPTQVIKRFMDIGVQLCDPDVFEIFSQKKKEEVGDTNFPSLQTADPTEGEVWNNEYFFEKVGERFSAHISKEGKFSFKQSQHRYIPLKKMLEYGYTLINDEGIIINEHQAGTIGKKIVNHHIDMKYSYLDCFLIDDGKRFNYILDHANELNSK